MACATREVEEETGWRPRSMQQLVTFQPMIGTIDQENIVYLAHGAEQTGSAPDVNEAERIAWIPLAPQPAATARASHVRSWAEARAAVESSPVLVATWRATSTALR